LKKKVNNQGFILEKPKREYKIYNLDLGNKDSKDNKTLEELDEIITEKSEIDRESKQNIKDAKIIQKIGLYHRKRLTVFEIIDLSWKLSWINSEMWHNFYYKFKSFINKDGNVDESNIVKNNKYQSDATIR